MIGAIKDQLSNGVDSLVDAWDWFWFTPRHVDTLAVLRICTGAMLLYSHLVLAMDLSSFLGTEAWINNDAARALHNGTFGESTAAWSYLWSIDSPTFIWIHHLLAIAASAAFMVGFLTRISGPLAWFLQLMILHRLLGSLFGLDQIVTYCAMYLAFTPCGAVFSIDAWLRRRREEAASENSNKDSKAATTEYASWLFPADVPSTVANVATRLLQVHMCVIYLFGGLAKGRGQLWWDGTAFWYAIGNYEYQSIDVTFLSEYPTFFTGLTHITLFWEIFYCALIWPKLTRPITLAIAVAVHGGIALFLGMATFGMMMIAANGIFLSPWIFRRWRGLQPPLQPTGSYATSGVNTSVASAKSSGPSEDEKQRIANLEKAEAAFKKRYVKLKRREAKVEERNERIRATKAKLREKLKDGTLSASDSQLDHLSDDVNDHLQDGGSGIDLNLSDPDLL
ncbi:Vitamin K-dependent gamma-carboxylase [Neorhodopirellula lusitana]|uniref:Vitamin K-dependent gamma-carboxylase n=1 Tax=Neorhodopirellula lusitana TaxID=445327 RepID=A0ABY1Q9Q4_9BACT|nr:HTTM domain-containing protein [Neorhodopirellula lusitana]SMP63154.1 Vitamin K-dependent gamma-carboxylase [Neorhodopirellula lusitana]